MNPFTTEYQTEDEDEALVRKALEGNSKALNELLLKHQPFVYNIAWKMVRHPQDAEDLTQEALLKITISLKSFAFKSSFRTWAYRIVVNHFLNIKKKTSETIIENFEQMAEGLRNTPDVEMTLSEQKENQDLIEEMKLSCMSGMLLCLTREQRVIYIIGDMFQADHTIGSEIMGISKTNYRNKLGKARNDLYSFMRNQCGLVNKANPCRCYKKVTAAVQGGAINAKELLFNKEGLSTFKEAIKENAAYIEAMHDQKQMELFDSMTYKTNFEKKTFIQNILDDIKVKQYMNLN